MFQVLFERSGSAKPCFEILRRSPSGKQSQPVDVNAAYAHLVGASRLSAELQPIVTESEDACCHTCKVPDRSHAPGCKVYDLTRLPLAYSEPKQPFGHVLHITEVTTLHSRCKADT
jgi:hypothetical protein